jgi:hypothetical protein
MSGPKSSDRNGADSLPWWDGSFAWKHRILKRPQSATLSVVPAARLRKYEVQAGVGTGHLLPPEGDDRDKTSPFVDCSGRRCRRGDCPEHDAYGARKRVAVSCRPCFSFFRSVSRIAAFVAAAIKGRGHRHRSGSTHSRGARKCRLCPSADPGAGMGRRCYGITSTAALNT